MSEFDDYLRRTYADAEKKLAHLLPPGTSATFDDTPLTVDRVSAFMEVPNEMLMDAGVIPDTRPPVHIPWYRRLRWRWQEWRERVGRRVGGWIAGRAPAEPVEEDTRWTDAQEAEYQRLDSLSLECQQRVCSGCDGLKWGPGNTPCAHDCHSTDEHGNRTDDCGVCTLVPSVSGWTRGTQSGCPVHGTGMWASPVTATGFDTEEDTER